MQAENQTERELTDMLTTKELLGRAQALEPQLVEWRRTLHRHPEVGFDLTQTKALVKKALTEMVLLVPVPQTHCILRGDLLWLMTDMEHPYIT